MGQMYNLIIVQVPKMQNIADFIVVRHMMLSRAPDIETSIIEHKAPLPSDFWRKMALRPTLIFSPVAIPIEPAARGMRLAGRRMTKLQEVELFCRGGFPVPPTVKLEPGIRLDERQWGPFVVLKPNKGGQGKGIRLARTRDAIWADPLSWPQDDPRHGQELIAQQYVYPGQFPRSYRVFTVLGKAIYSAVSTATEPVSQPDPSSSNPIDIDVTSNGVQRTIRLCGDTDIIDLAQAVHRASPLIPTMGVDIVREDGTGKLFVMEVNSTGFTWHLSSNYGLVHQHKYGLDYYGQFNALTTIADALVDVTRRLAA